MQIMCIFRAFGLHSPLQSLLTNQQVVQTIACCCVRPAVNDTTSELTVKRCLLNTEYTEYFITIEVRVQVFVCC